MTDQPPSPQNSENKNQKLAMNIVIGVSLGILFALLFDNLLIGLALGAVFGILLHTVNTQKKEPQ